MQLKSIMCNVSGDIVLRNSNVECGVTKEQTKGGIAIIKGGIATKESGFATKESGFSTIKNKYKEWYCHHNKINQGF